MMIPRSFYILVAVIATVVATLLWSWGIIPWWGIILAVPAVVAVGAGLLFFFVIGAWLAGGAH